MVFKGQVIVKNHLEKWTISV